MTPQRPSAFSHPDHRNSLLPVATEPRVITITRADVLAGVAMFGAIVLGVVL